MPLATPAPGSPGLIAFGLEVERILDPWIAAPSGADDAAKFAAAEDVLPDEGGTLHAQGDYLLPNGYEFTKPVRLVGQGDGDAYGYARSGFYPDSQDHRGLTSILCPDPDAPGLTFAAPGSSIADVAVVNTHVLPTSAVGVSAPLASRFHMDRCSVIGFYDCVDFNDGELWAVRGSFIGNPVRYGIRARNVGLPDGGDSFIGNGTTITPMDRDADSAIYWESGGGVKVNGAKINGNNGRFSRGLHMLVAPGITTVDALIANSSLENISDEAIWMESTGGIFLNTHLTNLQIATAVANSTAIKLTGPSLGTLGTVIVDDNILTTSMTGGTAIYARNIYDLRLGLNHTGGSAVPLDISGCARVTRGSQEETPRLVGAVGQPAFANDWATGIASYRQLSFWRSGEMVRVRGLISTAAGRLLNDEIFTLPVGWRPYEHERTPAAYSGGTTIPVDFLHTGVVRIAAAVAAGQNIFIDVAFLADKAIDGTQIV